MFYRLRKLYSPEYYQGPNRNARYFEGWYYKTVSRDGAFALIPGVSRAPKDPHAFIQYLDGTTGKSAYHRFPIETFSYRRDRFEIAIGSNTFSRERYRVALPEVECDVSIHDPVGWPSTLFSPGTMGWYSFVPFMECRHGIIVMDAAASGEVNGRQLDTGRLYVEKDFGRSFPNAWVWVQSNSFERTGVSLTCSVANVPFLGGAFTGFLVGFLVNDTLHRFTTYTGARLVGLELDHRMVRIVLEDRRSRLEIEADRTEGTDLPAPENGVMNSRVGESLRSNVRVELRLDGDRVFVGTGSSAGLEIVAAEKLVVR